MIPISKLDNNKNKTQQQTQMPLSIRIRNQMRTAIHTITNKKNFFQRFVRCGSIIRSQQRTRPPGLSRHEEIRQILLSNEHFDHRKFRAHFSIFRIFLTNFESPLGHSATVHSLCSGQCGNAASNQFLFVCLFSSKLLYLLLVN